MVCVTIFNLCVCKSNYGKINSIIPFDIGVEEERRRGLFYLFVTERFYVWLAERKILCNDLDIILYPI